LAYWAVLAEGETVKNNCISVGPVLQRSNQSLATQGATLA
jgi:hypothetical protein